MWREQNPKRFSGWDTGIFPLGRVSNGLYMMNGITIMNIN